MKPFHSPFTSGLDNDKGAKHGYLHIDLQGITQAAHEMASRSVGIAALELADQ